MYKHISGPAPTEAGFLSLPVDVYDAANSDRKKSLQSHCSCSLHHTLLKF